jgi:hypothetical protein
MNLKQRIAHATRRNIGKKTVNGKTVYKGLRGGLFTNNGTPVHKFNGGLYSTNKNFKPNTYMNSLQNRLQ